MRESLSAPLLPGVDESCNALYLSLVGEMPEQHCPLGCTLQANARGAIYVIDHVRRIGYPLRLQHSTTAAAPTPTPAAAATPPAVAVGAPFISPAVHYATSAVPPAVAAPPTPGAPQQPPMQTWTPPESCSAATPRGVSGPQQVVAPPPLDATALATPSPVGPIAESDSPPPSAAPAPAPAVPNAADFGVMHAEPTSAGDVVADLLESVLGPAPPGHKRQREASVGEQGDAEAPHPRLARPTTADGSGGGSHERESVAASVDPTAPEEGIATTPSAQSVASVPITASAAAAPPATVTPTADFDGTEIEFGLHDCLIPQRPRWLEDIFFTLQMSHRWPPRAPIFFYCHYCRVYFSPHASAMWRHLSSRTPHRLQRQRIRNYYTTKKECELLTTAHKRVFRPLSRSEIDRAPSHLFHEHPRIEQLGGLADVPHYVEPRSLTTTAQRDQIIRDGAAAAEAAGVRENLQSRPGVKFNEEPPELVGWRFIMHGLDVVTPYCSKCDVTLRQQEVLTHGSTALHREGKLGGSDYRDTKKTRMR